MNFLDTEITFPSYLPTTARYEHGPFAMWLVRAMKPRRIVELGTPIGCSYFAMCEAVRDAQLETDCLAVDTLGGGEDSGSHDESVNEGVVAENRQYAGFSKILRKTFDEPLEDVADGSVDLFSIARFERYEDVEGHFENWIPKLSRSAVVLFHGTEAAEQDGGAHRFWAELEDRCPSLNFRHCHGLGVLFWGDEIAEGLREFADLAADPRQSEMVVDLFAALGGLESAERALADREAQFRSASAQKDEEIRDLRQQQADLLARQREILGRLDDRDREIRDRDQRVASLDSKIGDLLDRLAHLRSRVNQSEHRHQERDILVQQSNELRRDLAAARNKPWTFFRQKHMSQVLYFLAEQDGLFSERRRKKFATSAMKRDPNRSLHGLDTDRDTPIAGETTGTSVTKQLRNVPHPQVKQPKFATTVMVVSHEASRSGAPILALNLVRELSKRHNVVSVSFGGGELVEDFAAASVEFQQIDRRTMSSDQVAEKVVEICRRLGVTMAFVNGVGSRHALAGLKSAGVRTIALLHEFAAYIQPRSAFPSVFEDADQVVFSTRMTLENALTRLGMERPVNVQILPQGKCVARFEHEDPDEEERLWLESVLRPAGNDDRNFLVLGAGTIETRKGIDLFIETATRVISGPGGGRFRFVWIGHGYDPENDVQLSAYLADQIERAGVQSQVEIVRATSEIDHAYALADLMLLSSRLDPLPNVAIDMLLAGKPVVCFDRTTGIADFLHDAGLGEACVARYLDTAEMADKIQALAAGPERLSGIATRGEARARETFDFDAYTRRLEEIAGTGGPKADLVAADLERIRSSGAFRPDFYNPRWSDATDPDKILRRYLRTNRTGPHLRKPMPGFNPLIYAEENGWGKPEDPFAEFLEAGRPEGRWLSEVIDDTAPTDDAALGTARVALHVHAFFVEEFRDILARLEINRTRPSLFVSAPGRRLDEIRTALESYPGPVAALREVPNRGRDIAPLLTVFGPEMVADFDIIGHLHTKRSGDLDDRKFVETWVEFLMENTLGGPKAGAMLDRIVSAMAAAPDLGIVYPDDPNLLGWSRNKPHAEQIAARMGLYDLPDHINYPMGTMFWARAGLIERFLSLKLDWDDYPAEPLPYDGSLLHALERLFGVVPAHSGFRTGVTNTRGLTR